MERKFNEYIWAEKFRPKKVKDIILPSGFKRTFNKYIKENQIPNLLLYSSNPGVGKTSLAKALCNDIGADKLYINASAKGGIDTLRTTIEKFASTKSFSGKPKVIIMDEADGTSPQLQQGLRGFIDEFSKVCRFIFTCNYITKIIDPIHDRCIEFDMNYADVKVKKELKPQIYKRIEGILKFNKIEFDCDVITTLIDTHYPSIRKIIQLCQQYSDMNGIIDKDIIVFERIDDEFYKLVINKEFGKARRYILDKGYNYDELYTNMYREYIPMLPIENQADAIITIAEYMYRNAFVIDKEINFSALLLELMQQ